MLTPANMQRYPHCMVMDHEALGVIIVSDFSLHALIQVAVKEIVKPILEANTHIPTLHLHMRPLCEAIIRRVYHFDDGTLKESKLGPGNSIDAARAQVAKLPRPTAFKAGLVCQS